VLLLFFFGVPFAPRQRGVDFLTTAHRDTREAARERWFDVGSWAGLLIASAGACLQIVAVWTQ
jgi:hypothetical protein